MKLDELVELLRGVRVGVIMYESELVSAIKDALISRGIGFAPEVSVAPRCRVDLLVDGGIAIEVKKGKPNTGAVSNQVRRYAASERVSAVILVSERGLVSHLDEANGKPVRYVAISKNWGIGL